VATESLNSRPRCQQRDPRQPPASPITRRASRKPEGPAFALRTLPSRRAKATAPAFRRPAPFPPALAPKAVTHRIPPTLPGPAPHPKHRAAATWVELCLSASRRLVCSGARANKRKHRRGAGNCGEQPVLSSGRRDTSCNPACAGVCGEGDP